MVIHVCGPREYRTTPWKNGRGTTTEIAVFPSGAGLDDFAWRVSRTGVTASGPFSIFPGIDRSLAVLSGGRLELVFEDGRSVVLSPRQPPYLFPADIPVEGRPLDGSILDLNIMTRRGCFRHIARCVEADRRLVLAPQGTTCLILPDQACEIAVAGERAMLEAGGAALLEAPHPAAVELSAAGPIAAFVIEFTKIR